MLISHDHILTPVSTYRYFKQAINPSSFHRLDWLFFIFIHDAGIIDESIPVNALAPDSLSTNLKVNFMHVLLTISDKNHKPLRLLLWVLSTILTFVFKK